MSLTVKEGNYASMGVTQRNSKTYFTFECEKEDKCNLVLIDKDSKEENIIEVPEEYALGSLRSVEISGINIKNYNYYYKINGVKIIDPYATKIVGRENWNDSSREKSGFEIFAGVATERFNWGNDRQPEIKKSDMVMYKLHVRGFTMEGKRALAGTFAGVKEKISYLKSLGVTTVEIMPVYEFEEMKISSVSTGKLPDYVTWTKEPEDVIEKPQKSNKVNGINYWGYVPGNYFSVKASYAKNPQNAVNELKSLIKELHKNKMECVMEMFFTENVNHNLIIDSLRYWVRKFHVDGFHLLGEKLPITAIAQDVMLSRTKIFYHSFPENVLFSQKKYKHLYYYEDEYLYPIRKILNHINGDMSEFINQQKKQNENYGFVNYIASNNGFTMADLFMYNDRHNEANGESNTDGSAWNFSNNCGIEGISQKKFVKAVRQKQWRNAMVMLFMAQGVPLIWEGDEFENSQKGNNNAYCQDNPIGWANWKKTKRQASDIKFVQQLAEFRHKHALISYEAPYHFNDYLTKGMPDVSYHGQAAWVPGIDKKMMALGEMYFGEYSGKGQESVYVAYNFFSGESSVALPTLPNDKKWYTVMDTSLETEPFYKEAVLEDNQQKVTVNEQSIKILVGR